MFRSFDTRFPAPAFFDMIQRPRLFSRRSTLAFASVAVAASLLAPGAGSADAAPAPGADAADRPNVLMIAVDDLRPFIGAYGDETAITPNMDRLASRGTVFTRAYCQQALCSPSRTSLLTGMRPDQTKVYGLSEDFRKALPDLVTLPQQFKQAGYTTIALGKIHHNAKLIDQPSWDEANNGWGWLYVERENVRAADQNNRMGPSTSAPDRPDEEFSDAALADVGIERLDQLVESDEPFFLAVGFRKPHLPFVAPKKYWDLYNRDALPHHERVPLADDAPQYAQHWWGELKAYTDIDDGSGPVPDDKARELIHGYYASVSFVDAQIGRLLDALDASDAAGNTVVVLWGDHGYHLGDHSVWCKHTNFENAVRSPLILAGPGVPEGVKTDALVEFVDVAPSLADLANVPINERWQGVSVKPLLESPTRPWKAAAFSQYPRGKGDPIMGYTLRTDRYRYVQWQKRADGSVEAEELYDHETDPDETKNLVDDLAHADELKRLRDLMAAGPDAARPEGL